MKKKIFILSLISVFFVSTTSLPLTVHLCKMAKEAKTCTCGKMGHCKMKCANNKSSDSSIKIELKNNCCTTKTIDTRLHDNYLTQQSSNDNLQLSVIVLVTNPINISDQLNIDKKYFGDFSPPLLASSNLYLDNSVLLI